MSRENENKFIAFIKKHALKIFLVSLGVIAGGALIAALPFLLPALAAGAVIGVAVGGVSTAISAIVAATLSGIALNDRRLEKKERRILERKLAAKDLQKNKIIQKVKQYDADKVREIVGCRERSIKLAVFGRKIKQEIDKLASIRVKNEELKLKIEAVKSGSKLKRREYMPVIRQKVAEEMKRFEAWGVSMQEQHKQVKAAEEWVLSSQHAHALDESKFEDLAGKTQELGGGSTPAQRQAGSLSDSLGETKVEHRLGEESDSEDGDDLFGQRSVAVEAAEQSLEELSFEYSQVIQEEQEKLLELARRKRELSFVSRGAQNRSILFHNLEARLDALKAIQIKYGRENSDLRLNLKVVEKEARVRRFTR